MSEFSWVQGMRPRDDAVISRKSWMEVLYLRLTGQLGRIESGKHALQSEKVLDLPRSVYFYVGHSNPRFGDISLAHNHAARMSDVQSRATPFDTGGLVHEYIKTTEQLSDAQKRSIVHQHTLKEGTYVAPFFGWLDSSFADPSDYVEASKVPETCLVAEFELELGGEAGWVWEGRVPARDYGDQPVPITRIFLKDGRVRLYFEWLRQSKILSTPELDNHLDMVFDLSAEVREPVASMKDYLLKEMQS